MFGWFKRKDKNLSRMASLKDHGAMTISEQTKEVIDSVLSRMNELPNLPIVPESSWEITHAYLSDADGRDFKVRESDFSHAETLVIQIDQAKRQKKKHSHLLAELKALEVK